MSVIGVIIAILILSILVVVHEFGHFILARKCGVMVKEFSIGFGPRIVSVGKGETKFSLKAIPFGGSCRMFGALEDDDDEDKDPTDERSFEKKSVWARMSIILGGPVFNILLAFVIAVIYVGTMGYDPAEVTYVDEISPVYAAGLREGDVITKYKGETINFGREIYLSNYLNPTVDDSKTVSITYLRDGEKHSIEVIPAEYSYYSVGLSYYEDDNPAEIAEVTEGGPLYAAGLRAGDIITSIEGTVIKTGRDVSEFLDNYELSDAPITFTYTHKGTEYTSEVTPALTSTYKLGFSYNIADVKTESALDTLKYSFAELGYQVKSVYKSLIYLFSGKASLNDISGPVGIAEVVSETYEYSLSSGFVTTLMNLLSLMMLISVNLGILNMLPLPALDGGKFILLIIEAIRRKPVSRKFEGVVTMIGASLLFILMIVVLFNDVIKLF